MSPPIKYVWTERDRDCVQDVVTPYRILGATLKDKDSVPASQFTPNHTYEFQLEWYSTNGGRKRFDDQETVRQRVWEPRPDDWKNVGTIRALCAKVFHSKPDAYPDYKLDSYDTMFETYRLAVEANDGKTADAWLNVLLGTIPYLIFDYWGNSRFRATYIAGLNHPKDWRTFNPANTILEAADAWLLPLDQIGSQDVPASPGTHEVHSTPEDVTELKKATELLKAKTEILKGYRDNLRDQSMAQMAVVGRLRALHTLLDASARADSNAQEPPKGFPKAPQARDLADQLLAVIVIAYDKLVLSPLRVNLGDGTGKASGLIAKYNFRQAVTDPLDLVGARAELLGLLLSDKVTADRLIRLFKATTSANQILKVAAYAVKAFVGSDTASGALRDYAEAADAALELLKEFRGEIKDAEEIGKLIEGVKANAADTPKDIAGNSPLEVLLSASGGAGFDAANGNGHDIEEERKDIDAPQESKGGPKSFAEPTEKYFKRPVEVLLKTLGLFAYVKAPMVAQGYLSGTPEDAHTKVVSALHKVAGVNSDHLDTFLAKDEEARTHASAYAAKEDAWAKAHATSPATAEELAAHKAGLGEMGLKRDAAAFEAHEARAKFAKRLNTAYANLLLQAVSTLLAFDKVAAGPGKPGSSNWLFMLNVVGVGQTFTGAYVTAVDSLAVNFLAENPTISSAVGKLGTRLNAVGAVLGLVTGVSDVIIGMSKGDGREVGTGIVSFLSGALEVCAAVMEVASVAGPLGMAASAASVVVGLVGGLMVEKMTEMPETPSINRVAIGVLEGLADDRSGEGLYFELLRTNPETKLEKFRKALNPKKFKTGDGEPWLPWVPDTGVVKRRFMEVYFDKNAFESCCREKKEEA